MVSHTPPQTMYEIQNRAKSLKNHWFFNVFQRFCRIVLSPPRQCTKFGSDMEYVENVKKCAFFVQNVMISKNAFWIKRITVICAVPPSFPRQRGEGLLMNINREVKARWTLKTKGWPWYASWRPRRGRSGSTIWAPPGWGSRSCDRSCPLCPRRPSSGKIC